MDCRRLAAWVRLVCVIWGAGLSFVCPARAQVESDEPVEVVVTANRIETPIQEVGSSITVVASEQIEESQKQTVPEVLQQVPGVSVVQSGGLGGNASVFLRGANSEHTLVLIDGVEANDPSSPSRAFNFADLPLNNIERIEVLRGSQSVLYGSDAMGGVINIITKKGQGQPGAFFSGEAGAYNTFTERAEAGGAFEKGDLSLGFFRQDSQGISAADARDGNTEHDGYENTSLSLRAGVHPASTVDLSLFSRYYQAHTDLDNFGGPGGDDPDRKLVSSQLVTGAEAAVDWFDRVLKQTYRVSYADQSRDDDSDPDQISPEYLRSAYDGSIFGLDLENALKLGDPQTLVFGIAWKDEQADSHYLSDGPMGPYESSLSGKSARSTGYYLEDQIALFDRLYTSAGVRADDYTDFGSHVTWRVAPALLIRESDTKLSGSVGTGFKAPALAQLYSDFGNPALDPEESLSVDAGIEQGWFGGEAHTGLTFFWNKFDNLITFDPNTFALENIAKAKTEGLEVYADGQLLDELVLGGSFTCLRTEDETTGERLLRRPKVQADVNLTYRWAEKLKGFLEVVFTGQREDNDFNTFPVERVDLGGYTLVNLAASYDLTDDWQLFGRIDNLFDKEYQDVLGYGSLGAAAYGGLKLKLGGDRSGAEAQS